MAVRKARVVPIVLPRRKKPKLTTVILVVFSSLGFIVFYLGFKIAPKAIIQRTTTRSVLPTFDKPDPQLLPNRSTLDQVNGYVNLTLATGSFKYVGSSSCKKHSTCEIHFPYLDLETAAPDMINDMQDSITSRSDFAVLTRKGFKSLLTNVKANQDRSFIISPLDVHEESSITTSADDFMIGLFDGHGELGHGTAHFAAMELPSALLRAMQRRKRFVASELATGDVEAAFKESFVQLDRRIPFLDTSGSTGIVILRIGSFLFIGSTGDSQAFLVKADTSFAGSNVGVSIVQSTVPHKPDDPLEAARIKANGGRVMPKLGADASSRVVIFIKDTVTLALAMSRCLGDPEGKEQKILIADPTVTVIDLSKLKQESSKNDQYFIVAASDGLLDRVSPPAVAQRIARSFYKDVPSRPLVACYDLIQQSSLLWGGLMGIQYRDDISIAVKRIDF